MTDNARPAAERLVQIHQAHDEWEGTLIVGYLRDNGIEASLQQPPALPPFDSVEVLVRNRRIFGISVLELDADKARQLVHEFVSTVTDERVLAETAVRHLKLEKERIHELREELAEEKKTFEALGWIAMAFFGATAVLWIIWPQWMKMAIPYAGMRWFMVVLLVVGALFAGSWANQRMK